MSVDTVCSYYMLTIHVAQLNPCATFAKSTHHYLSLTECTASIQKHDLNATFALRLIL